MDYRNPTTKSMKKQQDEDIQMSQEELVSELVQALQDVVTEPPLRNQVIDIDPSNDTQVKRAKRKSKFTKEQDEMIVDLKKKGKTWMDIAEITKVGSFLTARNRYQVLMGQQGVASTVWSPDDVLSLQSLVDEGELEKWRFISRELYKLTGKFFTDGQCRDLVRELFIKSPDEFGISEETVEDIMQEQQQDQQQIQHQSRDVRR